MKEIPLSGKRGQGKFIIVDDEDYEKCCKVIWNLNSNGYARGWLNGKKIYLHQLVMNFPDSDIDHRNLNKCDCQKENLRLATDSQNLANTDKIQRKCTSKYKGVYFNKQSNKWQAGIKKNQKLIYLGKFSVEEDAAHAYDKAAIKLFGEFANLNFPDDCQ